MCVICRIIISSPYLYTHHTQIGFLHGADGQPWVWVMGEHRNDLPYAELVREGGWEGRKEGKWERDDEREKERCW